MRLAITQSNYLPWRGFFAFIRDCDAVVQFDGVQFTKRDWRTRNRIRWNGEPRWITVPVQSKGSRGKSIYEIVIVDRDFGGKHWSLIEAAYRSEDGFADLSTVLKGPLSAQSPHRLSDLNRQLTRTLCDALAVDTEHIEGEDFPYRGDATQKLLDIALELGASTYVSGPAAQAYLDVPRFAKAGIEVEWADYSRLPGLGGVDTNEYSIVHTLATESLSESIRLSKLNPR